MADRLFSLRSVPTVDDMDPSSLTPSQWERRSDVFYHGTSDPLGEWSSRRSGDIPIHVGTRGAADHRTRRDGRRTVVPLRISADLDNTPDDPVHDAVANVAEMRHVEDRGIDPDWAFDPSREGAWRAAISHVMYDMDRDPSDISAFDRGLYYENTVEDAGSVSAVVGRGQTDTRTWEEDVASGSGARSIAASRAYRTPDGHFEEETDDRYSLTRPPSQDPRLFESYANGREGPVGYVSGEKLLNDSEFDLLVRRPRHLSLRDKELVIAMSPGERERYQRTRPELFL